VFLELGGDTAGNARPPSEALSVPEFMCLAEFAFKLARFEVLTDMSKPLLEFQ